MQSRRTDLQSLPGDRVSRVRGLLRAAAALAAVGSAHAGGMMRAMPGRPTSLAGITMSTPTHLHRSHAESRADVRRMPPVARESEPLVSQSNAKQDHAVQR